MKFSLAPEYWVSEHADYLYNFAFVRIYRKEEAMDLVQETFLAGYKAKDSFRGECHERTWLTSILKRKIIDYFRKNLIESETEGEKRYVNRFLEEGVMKDHWKPEFTPHSWDNPEEAMLNEEFQKILMLCLSGLSKVQAAVFTLKVMDDRPTEEVCKEFNISASNIWTSLHRAKMQIRDCIEAKWFDAKN